MEARRAELVTTPVTLQPSRHRYDSFHSGLLCFRFVTLNGWLQWKPAADDTGATQPAQPVEAVAADDSQQGKLSEQVLTALRSADKLDGTEDKVVEQCYSCMLGMKGKPEFASQIGEYDLHFCKEGCQEHFDQDPEYFVTSTELPESDAH